MEEYIKKNREKKCGVVLVNLGTPSAPTVPAIRRYLIEFLSDKRVVDLPKLLWLPILYCILLPFRSSKLAKLYQAIWMEEGSPLLVYSHRQQRCLQKRLPDVSIELAMSYGKPTLSDALDRLLSKNVSRILLLPLYPQYSSTVSAPVFDIAAKFFFKKSRLPSLIFIRDYAVHPTYIEALYQKIIQSFSQYGRPDVLIFSYHGIPQSYVEKGDDYPERCLATTQVLVKKLGLYEVNYKVSYQSRVGCATWLRPYTNEIIKELPKKGVKHIQIICPGFSVDCLETLYEIQIENREIFLSAGGKKFHYIPALNDEGLYIDFLQQIVTSYCFG